MIIVNDIIKFAFSILLLFYVPGHLLLGLVKKKFGLWERIILSFSIGLFIIPQVYYYLEKIRVHNLFLIAVILCGLIYPIYKLGLLIFSHKKKKGFKFSLRLSRKRFFLLVIISFLLVITALAVSTSGIIYDNGMRFYQANAYDSVAQLAMVEELSKNPPHEFPFYSGLAFRGYYVGAFYWRALVQKVTGIDSLDLFFRYCPIFLFPLIVMMTFAAIKSLTGSRKISLLATFLMFLMSDLSWIFPVVDRILPLWEIQSVSFKGSLLDWIMFNPPFAHGILIFFMGCYFLRFCDARKNSEMLWPAVLFTGMLFGSLFEYKAFMWATVFPALILISLREYFFNKKSLFLKISLVTVIFSFISFLRVSSGQALSLFRFNLGYYPLAIFREMGLMSPGGKPGFFVILTAFLLFLAGALGIKIVGFYKIYQYLKKWRETAPITLFLIFSMAFSFIFTHTLLLESNYPYATYNFFAVFLLVMAIFAAPGIIDWAGNSKTFLKTIVYSAIFIIGIGSTAFSFLAYFPKYSKYKLITKETLGAIGYIKKNSGPNAVILHNAPTKYWISGKNHKKLKDDTEGRDSFISALTARRAVIDCPWHMAVGNYAPDLKTRQEDAAFFFKTKDKRKAKSILHNYKVSYVWADREGDLNFKTDDILKKIFSNEATTIYRVL
jgi:hypothetical protein